MPKIMLTTSSSVIFGSIAGLAVSLTYGRASAAEDARQMQGALLDLQCARSYRRLLLQKYQEEKTKEHGVLRRAVKYCGKVVS